MVTQISKVKLGDFIHLKDDENSPLWVRGSYERSTKKYSLISYEDANKEIFRRGSINCYVF